MSVARSRAEVVAGAALVALSIASLAIGLDAFGAFTHGEAAAVAVLVLLPIAWFASGIQSIRRHGDRVLDAGVAAVVLVLVVGASFVFALLLAGRLPDDADRWILTPAVVGALVAALAFGPARARGVAFARTIGRHGRRRPEDVVRSFGDRASRGVPDIELLQQLVEALHRTFRVDRAEIWTGAEGMLDRVVSVPDAGVRAVQVDEGVRAALLNSGIVGEAWLDLWMPGALSHSVDPQMRVAPASFAGELLGLVVVERTSGAARFTTDEDLALAELGRRLGVVLHNRQLDATLQATLDDLRRANEDLRASRARLVAAADGERRRLERDLHDGAQQHLVALAVRVRLARDLMRSDPEAAAALIDELGAAIGDSIDELRDLAHGIYPPLLRDKGLIEALRAAARRQAQPITVEAEELSRYPADVESAVYFACLEALQNAAKHAPSASISLRLRDDRSSLQFEVRDDGPGFEVETVKLGHGLRHMSDRLGAVGGTVGWTSAPGRGTRIAGSIPGPFESTDPGRPSDGTPGA